jgi:hypothetical protein
MTNRLKKTGVALTLVLVLACAVAFPWLAIVKKDKKSNYHNCKNYADNYISFCDR